MLRGESLPQSKLTEDDIRLIRDLDLERIKLLKEAALLTRAKVALKFDVHVRTIEKIISGETWSHIA